MTDTLHVYLNSEDSKFNFSSDDFRAFSRVHPSIEVKFLTSAQQLLDALPGITWLDTWHFDAAWFALAPKLRHLFTPAAGREYVALDHSGAVTNHYGTFHGTMMAESALSLVLQFSLNLPRYRAQQSAGIWNRIPARLLRSQTALIIGYGNIGKQTARLLCNFGMSVRGHQRIPTQKTDGEVALVSQAALNDHLPLADHIISFLPGGEDTRHFFSAERFNTMSEQAYFYNFGRGTTVDETALLNALDNNTLAGAGLDVTETEPLPPSSGLWRHPKVLLLPHASSYFEEYRVLHVTELANLTRTLLNQRG